MVHQYKLNGYDIVLDVSSGAVHAVDDFAYDVIALMGELGPDQPREELAQTIRTTLMKKYLSEAEPARGTETGLIDYETIIDQVTAEVFGLMDNKLLFTPEEYAPLAGRFKEKNRGIVKALCLHVAHSCNLNCEYCFASQGRFKGDRALMNFEVGKRALDYLVENSGSRRNLEVDFFGGEPLLNWEVVKQLVAYARSIEKEAGKNFRFTFTTNGMLVDDEVIDFCNREMHNVVLSLDGRKEVHDRFRKDYAGEGSWERIVPKFQHFVEKRAGRSYYMRGTFTHANPDFVKDIEEMLRLGFTELSMEPVVCAPDDPYALTDEDVETVKGQYEKLAKLMIERRRQGRPFTFYHYMIDLGGGPCIYKRISGCGSGTEYMAVTPWGDLYPCHQFVSDAEYKLGDVWNGVTNTALRDEFEKCNVYAKPECADCWAKLYCSGGCAANCLHASGRITGVYEQGCELFRKRMECAIMLAVDEAQNGAVSAPDEIGPEA